METSTVCRCNPYWKRWFSNAILVYSSLYPFLGKLHRKFYSTKTLRPWKEPSLLGLQKGFFLYPLFQQVLWKSVPLWNPLLWYGAPESACHCAQGARVFSWERARLPHASLNWKAAGPTETEWHDDFLLETHRKTQLSYIGLQRFHFIVDFGNLCIYKKRFNIDLEEFCGNKLGDTWFYSFFYKLPRIFE